jgi:dihydrofolate reductase
MRKLKIIEHISLDGVIQAPGGPNEDGDYPYGGWTAPYRDPAAGESILAAHSKPFDLLLGRRTCDIWSGHWPKAPSSPLVDSLNAATKYVATHRPDSLEMGPVRSPWTGNSRGSLPHQGERRAGPDPLGQFDPDIDTARTRAGG